MKAPVSRLRGFTLLEIMIVVFVVSILTGLALFAIGRIKERAARSIIENNLRQLYDAKEFYYTETGDGSPRRASVVLAKGYLTNNTYKHLTSAAVLEAKLGWQYHRVLAPGEPVFAYRGSLNPQGTPVGDVIYYPGPPSGPLTATGTPAQNPPSSQGTPGTQSPPSTQQPSVNPPTQTPTGGTNQPPTTGTPATGPSSSGGNSATSGGNTNPPGSTNPSHSGQGPGNSDFGHSHHSGHPPKKG